MTVSLCVSVLVQLLVELQSDVAFRFVLDEIHKQVKRNTSVHLHMQTQQRPRHLKLCVTSSIILTG